MDNGIVQNPLIKDGMRNILRKTGAYRPKIKTPLPSFGSLHVTLLFGVPKKGRVNKRFAMCVGGKAVLTSKSIVKVQRIAKQMILFYRNKTCTLVAYDKDCGLFYSFVFPIDPNSDHFTEEDAVIEYPNAIAKVFSMKCDHSEQHLDLDSAITSFQCSDEQKDNFRQMIVIYRPDEISSSTQRVNW